MTVMEIYETHVKPLPIPEQLRLVEQIVRDLAINADTMQPTRKRFWREIAGTVPYPMLGEDAQEWVSRTRRESDEHRERVLRGDA